jgi:hypothetical protein
VSAGDRPQADRNPVDRRWTEAGLGWLSRRSGAYGAADVEPARAMKMQVFRALMARLQLLATLSLVMLWLGLLRIFTQAPPDFP